MRIQSHPLSQQGDYKSSCQNLKYHQVILSTLNFFCPILLRKWNLLCGAFFAIFTYYGGSRIRRGKRRQKKASQTALHQELPQGSQASYLVVLFTTERAITPRLRLWSLTKAGLQSLKLSVRHS